MIGVSGSSIIEAVLITFRLGSTFIGFILIPSPVIVSFVKPTILLTLGPCMSTSRRPTS